MLSGPYLRFYVFLAFDFLLFFFPLSAVLFLSPFPAVHVQMDGLLVYWTSCLVPECSLFCNNCAATFLEEFMVSDG